MIRKETSFRITKFKGKAVSIAVCGLFGATLAAMPGVSFAGNQAVANTDQAIATGDTPVFAALATGTATVVDGANVTGNATTGTNNNGNITFAGTSTVAGLVGRGGPAKPDRGISEVLL